MGMRSKGVREVWLSSRNCSHGTHKLGSVYIKFLKNLKKI